MNRLLTTLVILASLLVQAYGQNPKNIEYWRAKGFEAKQNGLADSSLYYYGKVLEISPNDWDALLATARLHYMANRNKQALSSYSAMLDDDSTDVQALNGMGHSYTRLGDYDKALKCFNKALELEPTFVQSILGKAKIIGDNGDLKGAIKLYESIIVIDSTVAESYAGKATMLYWSNKPHSALPLYQKALALDPGNSSYIQSITRMKRILAYTVGLSYVNIIEEEFWGEDSTVWESVYSISSNVGNLYLSKRLNDFLSIRAGVMMDYSRKEIVDSPIVNRRFDNYYINAQFIHRDHSLTFRYGYSFSDTLSSNYGVTLSNAWRVKKLRITNSLGINYDYFYYWKQVSRDYLSEHLILVYKKFRFETSAMTGKVRAAPVINTDSTMVLSNPFTIIRSTLSYTLIKKPEVSIVLMHEWRDYQYKSSLYWSPSERSLFSPGIKISHEWKDWYAYAVINAGMDNRDVSNVDGATEIGYSTGPWLFALGYSAYSNIYYRNSVISVVARLRL